MSACSKARLFTAMAAATLIFGVACASTQTAGEQINDSGITTKIKAKYTADPEINPFNIDVDTLDGVVTLRGEVEKQAAKDEAAKLASDTAGVLRVVNEIRVVSEPYEDDDTVSDTWITTKVKSKLTADPQLNPFNIDVDTLDGVVTLSGAVRSDEARAEAEKLARDTKGVVSVRNQLSVEPKSD